MKPEQDDTGQGMRAGREEIPEIEIERNDDPALAAGQDHDLFIREPVKPDIAEVKHVVTVPAQRFGSTAGGAYIGQEPHEAADRG